jgi:hypothetical protein
MKNPLDKYINPRRSRRYASSKSPFLTTHHPARVPTFCVKSGRMEFVDTSGFDAVREEEEEIQRRIEPRERWPHWEHEPDALRLGFSWTSDFIPQLLRANQESLRLRPPPEWENVRLRGHAQKGPEHPTISAGSISQKQFDEANKPKPKPKRRNLNPSRNHGGRFPRAGGRRHEVPSTQAIAS